MIDLRAVREARGWSQQQLADWIGVSQSLVAHWERGSRLPSDAQMAQLSGLERRGAMVVRMDTYPSAPKGGPPHSREAEERLAWMNARNRAIQAGVVSAS